ncbi:RagB/SusD family nutrient uptake outer membrane protein [Dysgonomonas sp. GY617]|uniref:RagB/SusD family nutrient uptake outer membrane protein n=1 Tax=Dysgonomonas sp. GY617 TaxID=2780420 RepID=UPI001883EB87|nr:RagB/SusD family nutrient uptake outer membrane protein [Dysgonomonas sp. GY617]MBF0575965.1 RagB/SusD family nutrient uptake outer membrane protein [Dysgonomonas sp. GY617]
MKKGIILIISILLLTYSCSDSYLEEKPYSSYTPETLKDSLGVEASLKGLHYSYGTIWTWSDQQGWLCVWQVGTDVASAAQQQGVEIPYYDYTKLTSSDRASSFIWERCYVLINNANSIISDMESASSTVKGLSENGKKRASAEAKFFRGYAYNMLATLFGGVPLVTEPTSGPKTDYVRASLDDINNLIISDLTFSAQYLPDIESVPTNSGGKQYGRANKFMAMQLLGEAYIRAGKPELAEPQLQSIISSGRFRLIDKRYGAKTDLAGDYYSDMFLYGNERRSQGNTETIWTFELENTNTVPGGYSGSPQQRRVWTSAYYNISGMILCDSLGGRGLARLRLSDWTNYRLYKDGDIRNSEYSIRRKIFINDPAHVNYGKQVPYVGTDTIYNLCPHTTKWGAFDPNDTFGYSTVKDWILMRLGETYLLLAEAQFKQGKTGEAANTINVLRQRAFPDYPTKGKVSASDITLDFILDERARELIGEENRRMTLMRTGTLVERAKLNTTKYQPIIGLTKTHLLLPIPLTEIQLNKDAVLEQNPGYD